MPTRLIWLLIATLLEDVVDWADRIARGEEADRAERRLAQRIAESARAMQEDAMAQAGGGLGRTEELAAGREGWEGPGLPPDAEDEEEDEAPPAPPARNPWRTVAFVALGLLALTYLGFWIGAGLVHG